MKHLKTNICPCGGYVLGDQCQDCDDYPAYMAEIAAYDGDRDDYLALRSEARHGTISADMGALYTDSAGLITAPRRW